MWLSIGQRASGRLAVRRGIAARCGIVALTLLMTTLRPALAVDPCDAKNEYDQHYAAAVQQKNEALQASERIKPQEVRPEQTAAQLNTRIRQIKADPKYLFLEEINTMVQENNLDYATASMASDALRRQIDPLPGEIRRTDDAAKKASLQAQLTSLQAALKKSNDTAFALKQKAKPLLTSRKEAFELSSELTQCQGLLPLAQKWAAYDETRSQYQKFYDYSEKIKTDYAAAVAAKNQLLQKVNARLAEEKARNQRTTDSLPGAPTDAAFYQKMHQAATRTQSVYEQQIINLAAYDCYPDARALIEDLKARIQKLDGTKAQIAQKIKALKTGKPATVTAKNNPPTNPSPNTATNTAGKAAWILSGPPVIRKGGVFDISDSEATFTHQQDNKVGQGRITWSGIPKEVREGETISLDMKATATAPAWASGKFNLNCAG